jgi:UDP-N-acetylmuramoyl-tripeptide--D-alanyl-D-alanine ligase
MVKFSPAQLAEWTGGSWMGGIPQVIDGVSIDSRTITPGSIFFAIRGPNFDGHDFISSAVRRGACGAVVARRPGASNYSCPILMVDDTTCALQDAAAGYRRLLKTKIIAVTGSVGKTTVKEMLASILSRRLITAKNRGNLNNEYGVPLSVLSMEPQSAVGVFELGVNHPGEMEKLCRLLMPDYGVVTAVGPVHLEFFGSDETVAREKSFLLKLLPENGAAFMDSEQKWFDLLCSAAACRIVTVGTQKGADYSLVREKITPKTAVILEKKSGESFDFHLPLPGRHVAFNCLFAVAVARFYGLEWDVIRPGLESYQTQPMRWETGTIHGILVINDAYNANPLSMQAALQTFQSMPHPARKWLVLAGMHELGAITASAHEKTGAALARHAWTGLITVGGYGKIIAEASLKAGMDGGRVFICADHLAAAKTIIANVRPGDAVMLKASRCEKLEKVLEIWEQLAKDKQSA